MRKHKSSISKKNENAVIINNKIIWILLMKIYANNYDKMKYTNFMENLTCQNQYKKKYKTYHTYIC